MWCWMNEWFTKNLLTNNGEVTISVEREMKYIQVLGSSQSEDKWMNICDLSIVWRMLQILNKFWGKKTKENVS